MHLSVHRRLGRHVRGAADCSEKGVEGGHHFALRLVVALLADFFALALAPYALWAAFSQTCRLCLLCFLRQALRALASFSARICAAVFGFGGGGGEGFRFPGPENVALAGAPKVPGCGAGGALHASPF